MLEQTTSPAIADAEWGKLKIDDGNSYKDAKLYPGGSRTWDWNETGTRHTPGIQPEDITELLKHGAQVVVLSQGFHSRLQVTEEARKMLEDQGIDYYILETSEAINKYNHLCKTQPVGALIHSTC